MMKFLNEKISFRIWQWYLFLVLYPSISDFFWHFCKAFVGIK